MDITPEWAAVALTALGMGCGLGAYIQRRITETRQAQPIIRSDWSTHDDIVMVSITIINRLTEDLHIERVRSKTCMFERSSDYDPATGAVLHNYREFGCAVSPDWTVFAGETGTMAFFLKGRDARKWLRLTMSSSAKTLRCKRFTIRPKTMD